MLPLLQELCVQRVFPPNKEFLVQPQYDEEDQEVNSDTVLTSTNLIRI